MVQARGAAALFIQNIVEKENINVETILFMSKLKSTEAIHTERIFYAFSRGTSITVLLASHTREPYV